MKALPWICGLSLVVNLALVAHTTSRSLAARSAGASSSAKSSAPVETKPAFVPPPSSADGAPPAFTRADTPLAKILDGSDLRAMRAALEASGLTAEDAKNVIRTRIRERQAGARQAIDQRRSPAEEVWWYRDEQARSQFEDQRRADRKALGDELNQTLASVFGPEPEKPGSEPIHGQAQFLPESKRLAVSRILQDYEAMQREARPRNYTGASLPSDEEKRAFIDTERRRDLAAILSPEEMREYDMRNSSTAQNLRWQVGAMKPSLDEYQAIYDMKAALDRDFNASSGGDHPDDFWQKRKKAETAGLLQLRTQLGEERYIDYALSNDNDARTVTEATSRYGLPAETARELWKLRQDAGREGKAIYDDKTLTRDEKRALIADLGARSREAITARLSPEVQAELKNNDYVNWAARYEKHEVVVYEEMGNGSSGYGL